MKEIREYLEELVGHSIIELQDESQGYESDIHNVGHLRAVKCVETWMRETNSSKESVFEKVLMEFNRLNTVVETEINNFDSLSESERKEYTYSYEYCIDEGKRCLFYELLARFDIVESETDE